MKAPHLHILACLLLCLTGVAIVQAQTAATPPQETPAQGTGEAASAPVPLDELRHGPRGPMDWMEIRSVSPDGSLFVTINRDNQQCVREVISGKTLGEMPKNVTQVIFSPDARTIACQLTENPAWIPDRLQFYNTADMHPIGAAIKSNSSFGGVFFSPDGRLLAGLSDVYDGGFDLTTWDAVTGKRLASQHTRGDFTGRDNARFSPDGKVVAWLGFSGVISLRSVPDMKLLQTIQVGNKRFVSSAFSPNGKFLAVSGSELVRTQSSSNEDSIVRLYKVATGKLMIEQKIPLRPTCSDVFLQTKFFPDSKAFVTAFSWNVWVWSAEDGKLLADLVGMGYPMALSPDGKTFAARDQRAGIQLYDATNWNTGIAIPFGPPSGHYPGLAYFDIRKPFETMVFSPDGATLVIAGYDKISAYAIPSGKLRSEHMATQWEDYVE